MINKMRVDSMGVHMNFKKRFNPINYLKPTTVKLAFDFAYDMTFGKRGEHRDHRSGGTHTRKKEKFLLIHFKVNFVNLQYIIHS